MAVYGGNDVYDAAKQREQYQNAVGGIGPSTFPKLPNLEEQLREMIATLECSHTMIDALEGVAEKPAPAPEPHGVFQCAQIATNLTNSLQGRLDGLQQRLGRL